MEYVGPVFIPAVYDWVRPVNEWLASSSPFALWLSTWWRRRGLVPTLSALSLEFEWMVGLQIVGSVLLLLLAIWQLRPTFRRQADAPARRTWFGTRVDRRRLRWLARPACGDDGVLWKERYFAPGDIFTKFVLLPAVILVTVPLALLTEVEGRMSQVFLDLWRSGWSANGHRSENFVWALQVDLGWYTAFWLLAVAGASASSVTIEREEDTWISLTATPLSGWEILRAKVLGAIWNQRGFGAVLIFLWAIALVTGTVSPRGVFASMAIVALLTWLVAAIGIHASLRATFTSRALSSTIVALCLFNGYQFVFIVWFLGGVWLFGRVSWDSSFGLLGAMPMLAAGPLVPTQYVGDAWWNWQGPKNPSDPNLPATTWITFTYLLVGLYAISAILLSIRVIRSFDRWLDRPPLSGANRPHPEPRRPLAEARA